MISRGNMQSNLTFEYVGRILGLKYTEPNSEKLSEFYLGDMAWG
jgi:hypothetical protein